MRFPLLASATLACGLLAILGALPGLGMPAWLLWLFKPLTTMLIVGYALRRPGDVPRRHRYVLIGLALSLLGDVALLWPQQGFVPGLVAFLFAHLCYLTAFCATTRLAARPIAFVAYALLATAVLFALWPGVPEALRLPVLAYVICLAAMAAQAAAWWLAERGGELEREARRAAIGGALFMGSDTLIAVDKFAAPLPLAALWILASYWLAQWLIASSLLARKSLAPGP